LAQDSTVEVSSSSSSSRHRRRTCHRWSPLVSSRSLRFCSAVRSVSRGRDLRTLAPAPTLMLTGGIRRPIILNSLMWLKCVLHLQVLHTSRYLPLQRLIPMVLTPVQHMRVLLQLLLLSIVLVCHLQRESGFPSL